MRKGLVTLGVVALFLAVSPVFAVAPVISCMPDLVVSDVEQNAQTVDANLFIFSEALNLDDYVSDEDTSPISLIRWSYIQTSGPTLELNGLGPIATENDALEPGASDLRAVSNLLTVENTQWTGSETGPVDSMVEMYVSDGSTITHSTMKVTTVNRDTQPFDHGTSDSVLPQEVRNFGFAGGAEGWTWFEITVLPEIGTVAHTATGGQLTITEPTTHDQIMFGAYESTRDPASAVLPRLGCLLRARYQMSSSQTDQTAPGFRLRGLTSHVAQTGGVWNSDFANQDYTSFNQVQFSTLDAFFVAPTGNPDLLSRIPGAGQEYVLILFPRQVRDTLLSEDPNSPVVHYFTVDLLDLEGQTQFTGNSDNGDLVIDSVIIEGIDRPELGAGTAVPGLSFTDFSGGTWSSGVKGLGQQNPGAFTGSVTTGADLVITVAPGDNTFEAFCEMATGETLETGRTYRLAFSCTSSETSGGDAGPTVRTNLTSSAFVYSAVLELQGGALLSRLSSTESLMELWVQAPSEVGAGSGTTEEMKAQFISYLGQNVALPPFNRTVSGTVTCTSLQTEVFDF